MKVVRRSIGDRDQHASVFSAALMRLCDSAGALGAALVDPEGETVDYAGVMDPFATKLAAAEWAIVYGRLKQSRVPALSATQTMRVRAGRKSYIVRAISADYSIVVLLPRHAFAVSERGFGEAVREVALEAGLPFMSSGLGEKQHWCRIDVRCEPRSRRPDALWLRGGWVPVELLGRYTVGLASRETGYRARLPAGAEITLVRERLGRWFTEAPVPF